MYDDAGDIREGATTLGEVWADFVAVATAPARRVADRALRWTSRLLAFDIDWDGFGYTRGGFFDGWLGPVPYRPDQQRISRAASVIVAAGGWCAPWEPPRWQPWTRWWPGFDSSWPDSVRLTVVRGGTTVIGGSP